MKNETGRGYARYGARRAYHFRWANLRKRKKPLGRFRRIWDDHFKRDIQEIGWRHGLD